MISKTAESWFLTKRNVDFHVPDRWWISLRITQYILLVQYEYGHLPYYHFLIYIFLENAPLQISIYTLNL